MRALFFILTLSLLAQANEERPYIIPLPGGGTKQATEKEYLQWSSRQRQFQQRQQMQQQMQNQLQSLQRGAGGGGGGGGNGGGGGSGTSKSSNNANSIKPLDASAFGQIPGFSSNPSQKALDELIAQSGKPDSESQKFLEDIKKQIEDSAQRPELPQLDSKIGDMSEFNLLLQRTMAAIRSLPTRAAGSDLLLRSATSTKKRRIVGRPMDVLVGKGLATGQSRFSPTAVERGLASLKPVTDGIPRGRRGGPSSHRHFQ